MPKVKPKKEAKLKRQEPQWNHVICARDWKTLKPRMFHFLTNGDDYLLVKEVKTK